MIKAVSVTNPAGETLRCILDNPDASGFSIAQITGITPGKATVNIQEIATLDGGMYSNSRMTTRNIVIDYIFHDYWGGRWVRPSSGGPAVYIENRRTIEEARQEFYRYFIVKKPVTIQIETDLRTYEIDGIVESNEPNIFSDMEGAQVSILCPVPYFRWVNEDPFGSSTLSDSVFYPIGLFSFPFSDPVETREIMFGDATGQSEQTSLIYYDGDVDTGVVFRAKVLNQYDWNYITFDYYGTGNNPSLQTRMQFNNRAYRADNDGVGLLPGDELVISTLKGNKYAVIYRGSEVIDAFPYLRVLDDWITFSKGTNHLTVMAGNAQSEPFGSITVEYPLLFSGV